MVGVTSFTEAGGHAVNEDAVRIEPHPADPNCWVADGQGGRAGGGEAARLACRTAVEAAARVHPDRLTSGATWVSLLGLADRAVAADAAAGFTTLVGLCIRCGVLAGASSGDSAVLVTAGGEAREATAGQRKNPPVGSGGADFAPFAASLAGPWAVLVVSDGVWKYAGWDRIIRAAAGLRGEALVDALKTAARLPGSGRFPDDFTVVVFEGQARSGGPAAVSDPP
ncbi:MAG TPA: protein phosphatase 2C domain-containing protein [Urbifossiella sp.]|jgi:hypothetical protein|nr:protein phosphatase 2C domain-containing protein [Urbifossiella sp.]